MFGEALSTPPVDNLFIQPEAFSMQIQICVCYLRIVGKLKRLIIEVAHEFKYWSKFFREVWFRDWTRRGSGWSNLPNLRNDHEVFR